MKRVVLGDWEESEATEVVQLEVGEMVLVEALPPKPVAPSGRLVKVSLFGQGGALLAVYHVGHPTDMKAVFESINHVYGMTVEWVS